MLSQNKGFRRQTGDVERTEKRAWTSEVSTDDVEVTSDPVIMPQSSGTIAVTLVPSPELSVTGVVEASTNSVEDIEASASNVVWVEWAKGQVNTITQDLAYPPTAMRVKVTGGVGTVTAYIRAR